MKFILVVLVIVVPSEQYEIVVTNYHGEVGIPEAARIKAAEAAMTSEDIKTVSSVSNSSPYMVGLIIDLTTGEESVCGATLLSNTGVVTAAHCWRTRQHQANKFTAVLGSNLLFSGGIRIDTNNVSIHESYQMDSFRNDVAIVFIDYVDFNDNIKPVTYETGFWVEHSGSIATAVGFGRAGYSGTGSSKSLRRVNLEVITTNQCYFVYGQQPIVASTMCARAYKGSTCTGDTGGPLIVNNTLIAISSFNAPSGCERGMPAAFIRMIYFGTWLRQSL